MYLLGMRAVFCGCIPVTGAVVGSHVYGSVGAGTS